MKYEGVIIRPPSEARSLLIQATTGCSHNRCTFCGAYKWQKFRIKSFEEIKEDIDEAAAYGRFRRVFLPDGDVLIMPQRQLVPIIRYLKEKIRGLERIGVYGNAKSILKKTPEELTELNSLGLDIVYMGLESGSDEVLKAVKKGVSSAQMIEAARRAMAAGWKLSITVLLGLGGLDNSHLHARETARVLSEMDPHYVGALSLMLIPGTPLYEDHAAGKFKLPDPFGLLEELGIIISQARFSNCFFASNHASNYLPIKGTLPKDQDRLLAAIGRVLSERNTDYLRPEYLRAL